MTCNKELLTELFPWFSGLEVETKEAVASSVNDVSDLASEVVPVTFNSLGDATGGFARLSLKVDDEQRSVICKSLINKTGNISASSWASEALMYCLLNEELPEHLRCIPHLYGIHPEQEKFDIFIEDLGSDYSSPKSYGDFIAISKTLGKLSRFFIDRDFAFKNRKWLPVFLGTGTPPKNINQLKSVLRALGLSDKMQSVDEFFQDRNRIRSLYSLGIRTVCHGDLNPFNVMLSKQGSIKIIDWGRSSIGMAGDDLTRVVQPNSVLLQGSEISSDVIAREKSCLDAYIDGFSASEVQSLTIRRSYRLKSLLSATSVSQVYLEKLNGPDADKYEDAIRDFLLNLISETEELFI